MKMRVMLLLSFQWRNAIKLLRRTHGNPRLLQDAQAAFHSVEINLTKLAIQTIPASSRHATSIPIDRTPLPLPWHSNQNFLHSAVLYV